ncbi:MAG TPA: hypothetical protein VFK80_08190 [Limnochordia bacterium]|nr:hypothetical protein [Limnochordia bacterium]
MKLDGRGIFGYFTDRKQAQTAVDRLHRAGFVDAELDLVHRDTEGLTDAGARPITGDLRSLSELTLGANPAGDDSGILLSASPDASGLAHELHGAGFPEAAAWLVVTTAETDHESQRARDLMHESGAIRHDL